MAYSSVLAAARSQIGTKESPAGSNRVKYNTWYYGRKVSGSAYPWCAVFMSWCFSKAGCADRIKGIDNQAYCPSWVSWAKKTGRWDHTPSEGAIVLFDWDRDGIADHIGIVEQIVSDSLIVTIEGNTSVDNNSNGGQVMRRTRNTMYVLGYAHITIYPKKAEKKYYEGTVYCYSTNPTHGWRINPAGETPDTYLLQTAKYMHDMKMYGGKNSHGRYGEAKVYCYGTNPVKGWKISPDGTYIKTKFIKGKRKI